MNERSRPIALCSTCGAYSYDRETLNTVCNTQGDGGKCGGFWQNRSLVSDWETCHHCTGTGYIGERTGCNNCHRSGWLPRR